MVNLTCEHVIWKIPYKLSSVHHEQKCLDFYLIYISLILLESSIHFLNLMYITTWILTLIAVFTTKNILRISVTCVIYSISSTHSIRAVSIPFFNTLFLLMKRVFFDYVLQKSKDNGIIFIAVLNVFLFFVLIYIGCLEVSVTSHFFY